MEDGLKIMEALYIKTDGWSYTKKVLKWKDL